MSRLIVKNLPNNISDNRIKEHFSSQGGIITDVKLLHRPDGTSRRFAFIGFKTECDASKAKNYFDHTYIDSSRISVLVVDPNKVRLERPAKRQKLNDESTNTHDKPSKPSTASKTAPTEGGSTLNEFLEAMKPRNKKDRSWANDPVTPAMPLTPAKSTPNSTPNDATAPQSVSTSRKNKKLADGGASTPEALSNNNDDSISDLEWMRRRMATNVLDSSGSGPDGESNINILEDGVSGHDSHAAPEGSKPTDGEQPTEELLRESPRLYLRNLPYTCTVTDLEEAFSPFGQVVQAHIPIDPATQTTKGMAFITFDSAESAINAQQAMHRSTFQGRILHAVPAISRRTNPELEGKRSLKDQRLQKAKESASKDFNWSMLYMNSDAVVSSVADRMKISKADILNPDSDGAAVKLALAETHVIQETKKYLEDEGVLLDSFRSKQRSDTIILVKNIPYGTTISELTEMFSLHGEITRLLLPPAGTIAVVEFSNPSEAGKAFRAVAYRRLKNSIVYLEKGPAIMFRQDEPSSRRISSGVKPVVAPSRGTAYIENSPEMGSSPAVEEGDNPSFPPGAGATLFIKNINFGTTTEKLIKTFQHLPSFAFARVQMKPDPKRPGSSLSMGYGFIGFRDKDAAKNAMTTVDGFVLDGHSLIVKFAQRGAEDIAPGNPAASAKAPTTKVVVKNLPFEVTKKDVRTLFGAHGQLKSVRLPKKFNAGSRGFAFLEFTSHKEAENAMATLKHTHLLGRHVVLEWAEDNGAGGDLDLLRERVKSGYGDGKSERPGRKRRLDMDILNNPQDEGEELLAI